MKEELQLLVEKKRQITTGDAAKGFVILDIDDEFRKIPVTQEDAIPVCSEIHRRENKACHRKVNAYSICSGCTSQ